MWERLQPGLQPGLDQRAFDVGVGRVGGADAHVGGDRPREQVRVLTGDADARDGDADGDHDVDGNDFLVWQRTLGTAPPGAVAAVPEPGASLLALAALAIPAAMRRARRG